MRTEKWSKLSLGELVMVVWKDAWYRFNSSDLVEPLETNVVGWITHIDKNGIKICSEKNEYDHYQHEHYVPKGMVTKVVILE